MRCWLASRGCLRAETQVWGVNKAAGSAVTKHRLEQLSKAGLWSVQSSEPPPQPSRHTCAPSLDGLGLTSRGRGWLGVSGVQVTEGPS